MTLEKLLLSKQTEINKIVSQALLVCRHSNGLCNFSVSIPSSIEASDNRSPDFEILINLDKDQSDDIVVCAPLKSRIREIDPVDRHDFAMYLVLKLSELLGCSVNVCDEGRLKNAYPITYSKMRRQE
jgi:hypothetical protein